MKYLQYANQCYASDFHNDDLSFLASGEVGTSSHSVIQIINRLNCGVDIVKPDQKSAEDHTHSATIVLNGKPESCDCEVVSKMYGTSVDAYEALLNHPFVYGAFMPSSQYDAALRGLTHSES